MGMGKNIEKQTRPMIDYFEISENHISRLYIFAYYISRALMIACIIQTKLNKPPSVLSYIASRGSETMIYVKSGFNLASFFLFNVAHPFFIVCIVCFEFWRCLRATSATGRHNFSQTSFTIANLDYVYRCKHQCNRCVMILLGKWQPVSSTLCHFI